eukprot:5835007-Amphidinium_carterae.1
MIRLKGHAAAYVPKPVDRLDGVRPHQLHRWLSRWSGSRYSPSCCANVSKVCLDQDIVLLNAALLDDGDAPPAHLPSIGLLWSPSPCQPLYFPAVGAMPQSLWALNTLNKDAPLIKDSHP